MRSDLRFVHGHLSDSEEMKQGILALVDNFEQRLAGMIVVFACWAC